MQYYCILWESNVDSSAAVQSEVIFVTVLLFLEQRVALFLFDKTYKLCRNLLTVHVTVLYSVRITSLETVGESGFFSGYQTFPNSDSLVNRRVPVLRYLRSEIYSTHDCTNSQHWSMLWLL